MGRALAMARALITSSRLILTRFFVTLVLPVHLAACAATSNHTAAFGLFQRTRGFTAYESNGNMFAVTFGGNSSTTAETIQTYWLYNCAVLALSKGYDGFEVASGNIGVTTESADPVDPSAFTSVVGPGAVPYLAPYLAAAVDLPQSALIDEITLLKYPFQPNPPKVFDAALLKSALEPLVNGKKCDKGNICPHDRWYLRAGQQSAAP